MSMRILLIPLMILILAAMIMVPACGTSSTDPSEGDDPGDDPPGGPDADWPENGVGIPEADKILFQALADRYQELRAGSDPATARASFLFEAESWEGLEEAELLSDGSSIQFVFRDSVRAVLLTDEYGLERTRPLRGSDGRMLLHASDSSSIEERIRSVMLESGNRTDCGDIRVPENNKISLVNISSGIREHTKARVQDLKDHLVSLGWDPDDIDIHDRDGFDDYSWTLDDVFDQSGYGTVFILGQGGHTTDAQGEEHYVLEGFRGGEREDGYEEHVTQERWDEYMEWLQDDGTLVEGKAYGSGYDDIKEEIYIREDLLAEKMILDEGAMVHLLSNYGYEAADDLVQAGAGSATGWSDGIQYDEGFAAFKLFMENMMNGDDGAPMTDYEAMLALDDTGIFVDDETVSLFLATPTGHDFMLPAELRFDAPFDCLIEGTEYYDVNVNYPDCPENNQSFQFFPGGDFSLTGMPPVGAELTLTARDASGQMLGRNETSLELAGGPNNIELCPCEGFFILGISEDDIPPGATNLIAWIDYHDPEIPDDTQMVSLPSTGFDNLIPGSATVEFHAWGGDLLGYTSEEVEISCDVSVPFASFGWLKFNVLEWPEATTLIQVETDNPRHLPNPLSFDPSAQPLMLGMETYEYVELRCTAYDGGGAVLGTDDQNVIVISGVNQVELEFDPYGIILEAVPDTLPTEWGNYSEIKATVRRFTDFDTDIPTGPVIPNKLVTFSTDLGSFWGEGQLYEEPTDANGEAIVMLHNGDTPGDATILAGVDEWIVQSLPDTVTFMPKLTLIVDNRPWDVDGPPPFGNYEIDWVSVFCTRREVWLNDYIWSEDEDPELQYYYGYSQYPIVGDSMTYIWEPISGCANPGADPPYNASWMSSAYAHWFYEGLDQYQITVQLTGNQIPFTTPLGVGVKLTDPLRGVAPMPEVRPLDREALQRRAKVPPSPLPAFETYRE
jgi:hypothetical protein